MEENFEENVHAEIPVDIEAGTKIRKRIKPILGTFGNISSYFFSSKQEDVDDNDDYDTILEKQANVLVDAVNFSFTPEHMNEILAYIVSDLFFTTCTIMDWDRAILEERFFPSFDSPLIDDEYYWVHPLAPKLAIDEEFDINKFTGEEMSQPFTAIAGGGWLLGSTNVWIAELRLVEVISDIKDLTLEIQLNIGNRSDYLPCICKGDEILGKGDLLKPNPDNRDFILKRNTMMGLYVAGKTKEDLNKYMKPCGDGSKYILVERTLTSTILLETIRVSGLASEEIKRSLKKHDGKSYKLQTKTWKEIVDEVETHLSISPIKDLELKFRMYDGKRWEDVTSAELRQKIQLKFEIHPVIHFDNEEEKKSVIRRLIE